MVHLGPCSFAEAGRPVPDATIQASLMAATNRYAAMVRSGVPDRALSQNQFNALASFVYNVPALASQLLRHVNAGEDTQELNTIRSAVNIHDHDAHGHVRGSARYSPGLAARRRHGVDNSIASKILGCWTTLTQSEGLITEASAASLAGRWGSHGSSIVVEVRRRGF